MIRVQVRLLPIAMIIDGGGAQRSVYQSAASQLWERNLPLQARRENRPVGFHRAGMGMLCGGLDDARLSRIQNAGPPAPFPRTRHGLLPSCKRRPVSKFGEEPLSDWMAVRR